MAHGPALQQTLQAQRLFWHHALPPDVAGLLCCVKQQLFQDCDTSAD
jgi:hypothetical protein